VDPDVSELLVLCYHAISPSWSAVLSVTPDAFERQISSFARSGWSSATFSDAVRGRPVGKTLVITFDDSFASVKRYALPVLERIGFTATIFVPTDYISRRAPLAWAGLDHWLLTPDAAELTPLSWDDLGELAGHGWEVGSHTCSHPLLSTLSDELLTAELEGSLHECTDRVGRPVTSIAYPYGDVDARVARFTQRAGYQAAATLAWPTPQPDAYRFPRIGVYHKDSSPRFRLKVGGWLRSRYGSRLMARRPVDRHVDRLS
jgi:peptidoglycan/xylan/chitin deacetylase (PgdA/CDA1 family)